MTYKINGEAFNNIYLINLNLLSQLESTISAFGFFTKFYYLDLLLLVRYQINQVLETFRFHFPRKLNADTNMEQYAGGVMSLFSEMKDLLNFLIEFEKILYRDAWDFEDKYINGLLEKLREIKKNKPF